MRGPFRVAAGFAGALACGAAGAAWCALSPPGFEAAATASVEVGTGAAASIDLAAIESLVTADSVLRRAALQPEAAAAIERGSRPDGLWRYIALLGLQSNSEDTLSRAAEMLAPRVEARPGPWPGTVNVVARMSSAMDAAHVATAVANALVADFNGVAANADRRSAQSAQASLARAERRRAAARDRLDALRRIDFAPTASTRAPKASQAPEQASNGLESLVRAAAEAEARRLEAARTLGPKHPQLIQIETEARRAVAAVAKARARSVALAPEPAAAVVWAEGGPDPHATELAEAEREAARAEANYDVEAARSHLRRKTAQLMRAAPIPIAPQRRSDAAIVAASALLGFVFVGAAPALRRRPKPERSRSGPAMPVAILRGGALDPSGARRVTEMLGIADTRGARRVLVLGENSGHVRIGARAIALATLQGGWRPLLIAGAEAPKSGRPSRAVSLDGEVFLADAADTRYGPLTTARICRENRIRPVDANLAFDIAIFEQGACGGDPHAILWIGDKDQDSAIQRHCRRRGFDPRRIVGRISPVWPA